MLFVIGWEILQAAVIVDTRQSDRSALTVLIDRLDSYLAHPVPTALGLRFLHPAYKDGVYAALCAATDTPRCSPEEFYERMRSLKDRLASAAAGRPDPALVDHLCRLHDGLMQHYQHAMKRRAA